MMLVAVQDEEGNRLSVAQITITNDGTIALTTADMQALNVRPPECLIGKVVAHFSNTVWLTFHCCSQLEVVYLSYDTHPYHALSLSCRARNHRRRRAGVSHGKYSDERGDESHDHDRQRLEHHHHMRPARQWPPPAGRLRPNPARHQCSARGGLLDDNR